MKRFRKELTFCLVALGVVALDQVSKFLVDMYMYMGQKVPAEGLFRINYTTNTGGVFGLFANQAFLITLTAVVGILAILLYSRYPIFNSLLARIALGMMLGGAIGNLIDRIRLGYVVDFIDVGAWPVFNIADSAITIGVVLVAYYFLFPARKAAAAGSGDDEGG